MAYTSEFPFVYLSADIVTFALREDAGFSVLLIKRGNPPFQGRWAMPGGFVDDGEEAERAAKRELQEETGLRVGRRPFVHLGAYSAVNRDPRHRNVSMAYWCIVPADAAAVAGDDAAEAEWWPVTDALSARGSRKLAFDHTRMLGDAVDALARALETTTTATAFLGEEFTIAQLRGVYEAVWGRDLDAGNFQRKVVGTPGFVEDTGYQTVGGRGRPATIFAPGAGGEIWPPMSRSRDR